MFEFFFQIADATLKMSSLNSYCLCLVTIFNLSKHRHALMQVVALNSCHSLACHDTFILTQVRVDKVSFKHNELFLGVTRTSPARLLVTELSVDLEDSVIISYGEIYYQGENVSLMAFSPYKWLCTLV